jgi:hypothetical protein
MKLSNVLRKHLPYDYKVRVARVQRRFFDVERSATRVAASESENDPVALLCVYRSKNAAVVEELRQSCPFGSEVLLWALDEVDATLEPWTRGSGSGLRVPLLNQLHARLSANFPGFVVLADDDVIVTAGSVASAVATARRAGFGLSQPAHDARSHRSHRITEARPFTVARSTTFVECGPIVIISPAWRSIVLPMPEEFGMGPGLEERWMRLANEHCRLGVIDAVRIRHLGSPGADYDLQAPSRIFHSSIEQLGGSRHAMRTLATWPVWRRSPPWAG